MIKSIFILIILTLLPFLELRASLPYGIWNTNLPLVVIFLVCVITNFLLAPLLYFFLDKIVHLFLRFNFFANFYQKIIKRTQKKVSPYIQKYGVFGLAIFIGIPLPGSGVYSGTIAAYFLGFKWKDFLLASFLGVLIAAVLVFLASLLGTHFWNIFIKKISF